MDDLTYIGLGGLTYKEAPNGDLFVFGTASDPTLDLDQQLCDPVWLEKAMPEWFSTGANVREQHSNIAAGVGRELSEGDGSKWQLKAEVVDPVTKEKVKKGVLQGYSIGIKNHQLDKSKSALAKAPNGVIVGGEIVEISLVDRPANPSARVSIAKSQGGEWTLTKIEGSTDISLPDNEFPCPKCNGLGWLSDGNQAKRDCDACDGSGTTEPIQRPSEAYSGAEEVPADKSILSSEKAILSSTDQNALPDSDFAYIEPGGTVKDGMTSPRNKRHFPIQDAAHVRNALARASQSPFGAKAMPKIRAAAKRFDITVSDKSVIPDLIKSMQLHDPKLLQSIQSGLLDCIIQEANEMASGADDEISDLYQLLSSLSTFNGWWKDEAQEGETDPPQGDDDMAAVFTNLGVDADLVKAAGADDASPEKIAEFRVEALKALGVDPEAVTKAVEAQVAKELVQFTSRLETVESMAAPSNISKRATQIHEKNTSEVEGLEAQADSYRVKAAQINNDPEARAQGFALAESLHQRAQELHKNL